MSAIQPRRESEVLPKIQRQARGDGRWQIVLADGTEIGVVGRVTVEAPNGRRYRQTFCIAGEEHISTWDLGTGIFHLWMRHAGLQKVDQQIWLAAIEGARLVKEKEA